MDRSWISSRSDDTMVAVGFNPRSRRRAAGRRVATHERLGIGWWAISSVATRRGIVFPAVRGLKPTATVMCRSAAPSLRDEREARDATVVVLWLPSGTVDEVPSSGNSQRLASTEHILLFVINFVFVEEHAVFFLK